MRREFYEKFRTTTVKKGIIIVVAAVCLATGLSGMPVIQDNIKIVEAKSKKKDKKKPVFKNFGKTKITIKKGSSLKLSKVTAKDNVDGNVTNKIKVTVKKGKKNYSSIAKKIKNNKSAKYNETGKYEITYTVKDRAGNKATKKRYITVVDNEVTPYTPTTEATTEEVTTEVTTETPTTENPVVETPTPENPMDKDYPIYEYKFADPDDEELGKKIADISNRVFDRDDIGSDVITFDMEYDYRKLLMYSSSKDFKDSEYIKYFGKIKAYDENGKDISDNIVIQEYNLKKMLEENSIYSSRVFIYVEDENGNNAYKWFWIELIDKKPYDTDLTNFDLINIEPPVYGEKRYLENTISNGEKILKFE